MTRAVCGYSMGGGGVEKYREKVLRLNYVVWAWNAKTVISLLFMKVFKRDIYQMKGYFFYLYTV